MKYALLPGGFKPPHAGHYESAKYLAKNTDADFIIIKIGSGVRDNITPNMSLNLWNLYILTDPDPLAKKIKAYVSTNPSPVRDAYVFISDETPKNSTVYLGVGEKDASGDRWDRIPDFAEKAGVKAEIMVIPPQAGGISGTQLRNTIKQGNKEEFFKYVPKHLSSGEKEAAWEEISTIMMNEQKQGKTLRVFDFDDTLAKSDANIYVTNKDGVKNTLTPAQFALYDPKPGDKFNFKEFSSVIKKARPIQQNITRLKQAASKPNIRTTILTARLLGYPVKKYLKDNFNLDVYVVALGDANPQKKADWIEKQIQNGYTDIEFIDDSIKNIQAVDKLKTKHPDVDLKTELVPHNVSEVFSVNWWKQQILENMINEGGAAGHMAHPFNLPNVNTGRDLIKIFEKTADSLSKNPGSVKIDGVNASIRLVTLDGKPQFVLDRGSGKELDVKGITKDDLLDRFGEGHGMLKVGEEVLDIFNVALPIIKPELDKLGFTKNPNLMFNMEYVSGKTNVQDYGKNFIAIHGINEIKQVEGKKSRKSNEVSYDRQTFENLIKKLEPVAKKKGYEIYGSIPTKFTKKPNFSSALNQRYTLEFTEGKQTKTLKAWLDEIKQIPSSTDMITIEDDAGTKKKAGALTKVVYVTLLGGSNVDDFIPEAQDRKKAIDGFVTYLAVEKLGDEILKVADSPMGPVEDHEGIVVRDDKIASIPFKITGKFIRGGLESSFQKE
jgi:hypothetical protein